MLKKRMILLLAAMITAISVSGCGAETSDNQTQNTAEQTEQQQVSEQKGIFEEISMTDMDGNEVDSSVFAEHKLTMINIWATFCGPCLNEMPFLGELSEEYAQQEGSMQIIGIATDITDMEGNPIKEQMELAREITEQTGAGYLQLVPDDTMIQFLMENVPGVPTTFFVDSEGKFVGDAIVGARSKEEWKTEIESRLAQVEK